MLRRALEGFRDETVPGSRFKGSSRRAHFRYQILVHRSVRTGGCYGRDSWHWLQSRAGNYGAADASNGYLLAPQFAKRTYAGSYEGSKELAEKDAGGVGRR